MSHPPPPLVMAMTPSEFKRALDRWGEYSLSFPTGTTPGKRWLRNQTVRQPHVYGPRLPPDWWVGEYYSFEEGDPRRYDPRGQQQIGIRWYRVLIVE